MQNEQKPMSLENLTNYVKSLKERGLTGGSCVVEMGVIEQPEQSDKWLKRIVAMAFCVTLMFGVFVFYSSKPDQFTVILNVNEPNPIQAISKMVEDSEGEVVAVKHKEASTYEVKVSTRRSRSAFLEKLSK